MRIGIVGDVHWSKYSSIVRSSGTKYSTRLENCIASVNWAEKIIEENNCGFTVYVGDFFDSSELNSEEITALQNIKWNDTRHHFLVGNHEMGAHDLSKSSSHIFNYINMNFSTLEHFPTNFIVEDTLITFLPYILEDERKPLQKYLSGEGKKRIIFSHNDIASIQLGTFVSKSGFSIDEIEQNCDLFINGHLHNGSKITNKIINIGNLTGQNFSEDASKYSHNIFILDTDTLSIEAIENPYAMNFYKLTENDDLSNLKNNAVITIKCAEDNYQSLKNKLSDMSNVVASRIIIDYTTTDEHQVESFEPVDHLNKFCQFILNELGQAELVNEELQEILK